MSSPAEIKANIPYFLMRHIGEPLVEIWSPAFEEPEGESKSTLDYINTLVDLSQQAIDISRFRPARRLVDKFLRLSRDLPDQAFYKAQANVKLGWIADNETGYQESVRDFERARGLLEGIGRNRWEERHENLFSTTTHFLGRGRLGLTRQGINPATNLELARNYFNEDLKRFQDLRQRGNPGPINEGFQYLWLARCSLQGNNLTAASDEFNQAARLFDESLAQEPGSGIKAHLYLVEGLFELKQGLPETAREYFLKAVDIRTNLEPYAMGLAVAEMGVAKTYFDEKKLIPGLKHVMKAIRSQPVALLHAFSGTQ